MKKIGIIGVGYWGKNHLKALNKLKEMGEIDEIVVCDVNKKFLEDYQKLHEIDIETDWSKLLEDDKLDAVSIVTPSTTHYEIAKKFMQAGKDVLVEKPMALTVKECNELIATSNDTGSGLMVGHIFRFHPGVLEIRRRIKNGDFGEILYLKIWRQSLTKPRLDMGVMLALGIHEVDLTCFLLGDKKPDAIFADMNFYFNQKEEMAFIIQKFGRTTAYSFESWLDPTNGKLRKLHLIGSKGSAKLDFSIPNKITLVNSYLEISGNDEDKFFDVVNGGEFELSIEYKEPLLEEIHHFIKESYGNKQYLANGLVGKNAVEMINSAIESSKKGQFVKLK